MTLTAAIHPTPGRFYHAVRPPEAFEALVETMLEQPALQQALARATRIPPAAWHMSLSRTMYLKEFQVPSLVDRVREAVQRFRAGRAPGRPSRLELWPAGCRVFVNEERTCSFLAVLLGSEQNELLDLLGHVDAAVSALGHQPYYEDPAFHVSVAWAAELDAWPDEAALAALSRLIRTAAATDLYSDAVLVKSGPKQVSFPIG